MAQWTGTHSPGSQPLPAPMPPKVMGFLNQRLEQQGSEELTKGQFIIAVQEEGAGGVSGLGGFFGKVATFRL